MNRRRTGRYCIGLVALTMMIATTAGCETRVVGEEEPSSDGELVFSDHFDRDQLGPEWSRGDGENGSGQWRIEDGWLAASDIKNDPLWWREKLPRDVRVEFDAKAMSDIGDLKVEIFGDGQKHESGYILIFGGWENQYDAIARLDEHGDDKKQRASAGVKKGQTYHMAVERTGGTLRWYVDGELFMTYPDDKPLNGPQHRYFAFNNWQAPVRFDNFKVFDLGN